MIPVIGPIVFGGVLGIGWLTRITTPLVWVGAAAALARGSAGWAVVYGAAFGLGRSAQLLVQYLLPPAEPSRRVAQTVIAQTRLVRPLAAVGLAWLVVVGLALVLHRSLGLPSALR